MKIHLCKITGYETDQYSHFKDHLKSKAYNLAYDKRLLEVRAMKRDELRKLHKDEGLTNYSKLKKDELITIYMEHMKHVEIKTKNNKKYSVVSITKGNRITLLAWSLSIKKSNYSQLGS